MPHTNTSGAETPDPTTETMDTAAAQRVEQEKLTRRAALRKLGFGAGIAAFSLLGVDDFARMVGKRLERNAHDNKTAMAVAKEFQSAGIALANPNPSGCPDCTPECGCVCIDCTSGCTCAQQTCYNKCAPNDTICQGKCGVAQRRCAANCGPGE